MYWKDLFDWENYSLPLVLRGLQFLFAFIAFLASTKLTNTSAGMFALLSSLGIAVYAVLHFALVSKLNHVKPTARGKLIAEASVAGVLLLALIIVASSSYNFIVSTSASNACCVFFGFGLIAQLILVKITYTDEYLYEKTSETIHTPMAEV